MSGYKAIVYVDNVGTGNVIPGEIFSGTKDFSSIPANTNLSYNITDNGQGPNGSNAWELGHGLWNGTQLTRIVDESSSNNNPLSLSGNAVIFVDNPPALNAFGPSGTNHSIGSVPDPGASSGTTRFLREDATWVVPPVSSVPVTSVFTRTGAVVAANGDYSFSQISGSANASQLPVFIAAGASHAAGIVPDPGSTSHSPAYYLGDDGNFHSPSIGNLVPNAGASPGSTYTVSSADFMRYITSGASGGTLTVTLPAITGGFIVSFFRNTNNIVINGSGGAVIVDPSGQSFSSITISTQFQFITLVCDGTNYYFVSAAIPVQSGPTYTALTSGTANTYTPPAGCIRIKVRMIGGAGGGGGGGGSAGGAGNTGTNSVFGAWVCVAGSGGTGGSSSINGVGGAGGTGGANGSGTLIFRTAGSRGDSGMFNSGVNIQMRGGMGGSSPFGGAGVGPGGANGTAAAINSGSGGGGAGGAGGTMGTGGGGGSGEYIEFTIISPVANVYTVGLGGNGGTAGSGSNFNGPGGNGAAGIILIEEFYY